MQAGKIKLVILAVFALALAGGGVVGMLGARYVGRSEVQIGDNLPLSEELQLSPDQRTQIRQIWEEMRESAGDCYHRAEWLNQQRDEELMKILTDEQKSQYQKIQQEYLDHYTALDSKRQIAFNQAVERTKQLLNDSQRHRYELILARRLHGAREPGSSGPDHSPRTADSFMPSTTKPLPSPG